MKKYLQQIAELNLTQPKTMIYNDIYKIMKVVLNDTDLSFIEANRLLKKCTDLFRF